MNNTLSIISIIVCVVVIVVAFLLFSAQKKRLESDYQQKNDSLEQRILEENERIANTRQELTKLQQSLEKEQLIRDDISNKDDHGLIIELHVLLNRISNSLSSIDNKIKAIKDYSANMEAIRSDLDDTAKMIKSELKQTTNGFDSSINGLQSTLLQISNSMQEDLEEFTDDIDSTVRYAVSNSMDDYSLMDESDVIDAVYKAFSYNSYSYDSLNQIVERAVDNSVSMKLSDIESRLSSIEYSIE